MKRRGKTLTRIILSYSVMVCVPILIAMAVYGFTYGIVKQQAGAYNESLITMIKSSCDSEIRYYKSALENLRAEEELQQMSRTAEYSSAEDYWDDYQGQRLLYSNGKYLSDYCYDLFIWMSSKEKVVNTSSSMSYGLYEKIVCQSDTGVSRQLKATMETVRESTALGVSLGSKNYMILLEPVIGTGIPRGTAVLGLWVDVEALNQQISSSMGRETGMEWVLVDSQGRVIRDAGQFSVLDLEAEALLALDSKNVTVEDVEYLVTTVPSDFFGMKYILFTPETMIGTPANRIRTVSFLSLFLVLVIGCLASVIFTKMHYHPLKNLLSLLGGESGVSNEYEYIRQHVSSMMKESRDAEKKTHSLSRLYALESLLMDRQPENSFRDTWESLSKKFRDGKNLVLVFCEKGGFYSEEQEGALKEDWLRRFVVSNIFSEALGEFFREETFVYGNRVVTVVNLPDGAEDYREILQTELEAKKEFILQNFNFTFYVLEGGAYPGLSGISRSWQEACQAEAFISDLEESHIRYEEIRDMSVYNYAYSFALEESIVGAIRTGDAELAQSIVENLIVKSFSGSQEFITEMHACMLYDIYGTLVKVAEEQGCSITRFPRITAGSGMNRVEAMRESFREIITQICSTREQPSQGKQGELLSNVIQEYVEAHYADPDLNVSQIAYHLHMTPAWVSATFKKQTGKSLLSAIKQVRIQRAKELLAEGCSVLEVTKLTGFRESTTFIKIFKTGTGVTPGQYRKMNQNETDR